MTPRIRTEDPQPEHDGSSRPSIDRGTFARAAPQTLQRKLIVGRSGIKRSLSTYLTSETRVFRGIAA